MIDLYLYFAKRTILAQLNLDLLSSFSTAGNAYISIHITATYNIQLLLELQEFLALRLRLHRAIQFHKHMPSIYLCARHRIRH